MKNRFIDIDFEFNRITDPYPQLVSCALTEPQVETKFYWLHKDFEEVDRLRAHLEHYIREGVIFRAWAVEAEARCFLALGIDISEVRWIDLMLEYKCLTNHNHKLAYGKQLIDGKVVRSYPPTPKWMGGADGPSHKTPHHLASATYKLLDTIIDTPRKDRIRSLIISDPKYFTPSQKEEIKEYNLSDIEYLDKIFKEEVKHYHKLLGKRFRGEDLLSEMLYRGRFAACTAKMVALGYPINVEATRNLTEQINTILWEVAGEINHLFPEISPFSLSEDGKVKMSFLKLREWISATHGKDWEMTAASKKFPKGQLSLSLDAWTDKYDYRHQYPKDSFGAQMVRYLKYKQNLNGFIEAAKSTKRSFWDYVGRDGRVRPHFNIYGAQSGRSQPPSTCYIPLKPAWMRSLIQPPPGRAICGADWKSQEFLLSALISGDREMVRAYQSGDVYLYFAKRAGAVPEEGTKEEYKGEREKFKHTTLGLSYMMTKIGLSAKLSKDLGRPVSEEEAQELIDLFNKVYPTFYLSKEKALTDYTALGHVKMPSGWYLWGDNKNHRSVVNSKIQGAAGDIMRHAIMLAQDRGLDVILSLHDALYIEYDSMDFGAIDTLVEVMDEAFRYWFKHDKWAFENATAGIDLKAWSPDYPDEESHIVTPGGKNVSTSAIFVDERAVEEYKQFCKYFETPKGIDLL